MDERPDPGEIVDSTSSGAGAAEVMPMFPLQTVLLPTAVLPLQLFEPRYLAMIRRCLDTDRSFGVVLIQRGHEVGGGDERTDVGTVAQLVAATELPDGRWYVVALGTRRLRVRRWLADDPYPRAEIEHFADDPAAPAIDAEAYAALQARARRVLALAAEAGESAADATMDFADDPAFGTFQVAASLPLGPFDRQRVLATTTGRQRCALLMELCEERAADLEGFLTTGPAHGPDDPHGDPGSP